VVVAGRVERGQGCLEGLFPLRVLLLELLVAHPLHRGNERDRVPNDEVELAVAVDVSNPDPSRMRGAGEVALAEGRSVLNLFARLDQRLEGFQLRHLALAGLVPRPVDAAIAA